MGNSKQRVTFNDAPEDLDTVVVRGWLERVSVNFGFSLKRLRYYFVSREKIVEINTKHLMHDYPTDIITFDYCVGKKIIGEIFICHDVVKLNADLFKENESKELFRVIIHGLLHLVGFDDKTSEDKTVMREKENECLMMIDINE